MTTYTAESLAALPDRELDALVAEVVFGQALQWRVCDDIGVFHSSPFASKEEALQDAPFAEGTNVVYPCCDHYSTTWEGAGLVILRMRKLGFTYALYSDGMLSCPGYSWTENFPRARFFREGEFMAEKAAEANADTLPRAVAIASILAIQSLNESAPCQQK